MGWWDNIVQNLRSSFGGPSYAWEDSTNVQQPIDAGFMPSDSTAVQQPGGQPNPTAKSPAMDKTKFFEGGHKSQAYLDNLGKPTIGVGTLLDSSSYETLPLQYQNLNWSEEQGNQRFVEDYETKQSQVANLYGDQWDSLPQQAKDIMTDMAYNVGSEGLFSKFPGFVDDMKAGNYQNAAKQLKYKDPSAGDIEGNISDWWGQVGGTETESNINTGVWGGDARGGNRATYNYDALMNLGGARGNQPIDNLGENDLIDQVVTEQGSTAFPKQY